MQVESLRVVPARLDNAEHRTAIIELLDEYAREPFILGRPLSAGVRTRLIPAMQRVPTGRHFLAYVQGDAAGVAICFLGFSTFAAKPLLNVHDLAVRATWRGRGIGQALLERAVAAAREEGCCKVTLEVRADNQPAQHLYRKLDFRPGDSPETAMQFWTREL